MREALPDPALGPCLRLLIPTPVMPRIRSQARNARVSLSSPSKRPNPGRGTESSGQTTLS